MEYAALRLFVTGCRLPAQLFPHSRQCFGNSGTLHPAGWSYRWQSNWRRPRVRQFSHRGFLPVEQRPCALTPPHDGPAICQRAADLACRHRLELYLLERGQPELFRQLCVFVSAGVPRPAIAVCGVTGLADLTTLVKQSLYGKKQRYG